jgi:hypothetical protein
MIETRTNGQVHISGNHYEYLSAFMSDDSLTLDQAVAKVLGYNPAHVKIAVVERHPCCSILVQVTGKIMVHATKWFENCEGYITSRSYQDLNDRNNKVVLKAFGPFKSEVEAQVWMDSVGMKTVAKDRSLTNTGFGLN